MKRALPVIFLLIPFLAAAQSRPTIAVADFEIKAPGAAHELGKGLGDMLVNALVETGQFTVVERSRVDELLSEQGMALGGMVSGGSAAQVGQMLGAQYLVLGTITEFDENASGGGGGGIFKKALGAVGVHSAHIGFVMRVMDATSGVIHASKSIDKKARSVGVAGGASLFGIPIGGAFFKSKAMQNAVEQAINEAVGLLAAELSGVSVAAASNGFGGSNGAPADCRAPEGRIMVIIPEEGPGGSAPIAETAVIRRFLESGLDLVDQGQIDAIRNQERVVHAFDDPQAAAELGVEFGAEIVVVGQGTNDYAGSTNNMRSARAHVEARIIEARTGRLIAANGMDGSGLDLNRDAAGRKALGNAAESLAGYLLSQLCSYEPGSGSAARTIEIMLSGISFGDLNRVAGAIEGLSGVRNVEKSLTGGIGRLQVQFAGPADELATAVSPHLEIVGFAENKLEAKVR